jgi:hypothetical protein
MLSPEDRERIEREDLLAIFAINHDAQITPAAAHRAELYRRNDAAIRAAVWAIRLRRQPHDA